MPHILECFYCGRPLELVFQNGANVNMRCTCTRMAGLSISVSLPNKTLNDYTLTLMKRAGIKYPYPPEKPKECWTVFESDNPPTFKCLRCGHTYVLALPLAITEFCKAADKFEKEHMDCTVNWITIKSAHPMLLSCLRCGVIENFNNPLSKVDQCVEIGIFETKHKNCKEVPK